MAIEAKRGCGYRKVGGLYLVSGGGGVACDRLPLILDVCPCCSHGFKQTRGWTWVDVNLLVSGVHRDCHDDFPCPLCMATPEMGKAGLLWIGEQFYPTAASFADEAARLGISRRVRVIPRNFKVGEAWILLAHPKAVTCPACLGSGLTTAGLGPALDGQTEAKCPDCKRHPGYQPGVFRVFRPERIEKIITETQSRDAELMADLAAKGITPVIVPDNDRDHQGSVYDDQPRPSGTDVRPLGPPGER